MTEVCRVCSAPFELDGDNVGLSRCPTCVALAGRRRARAALETLKATSAVAEVVSSDG